MALLTMQKKNLDSGSEVDVHWRIQKGTVTLDRVAVTRVTFGVGARWSKDLRDYAGTESCYLPHVALVQSGRLKVVMDDGSEEEFGPNDVMMLPPGHDACTVGDQPCVFVEFSDGNDYYREALITYERSLQSSAENATVTLPGETGYVRDAHELGRLRRQACGSRRVLRLLDTIR